MNGARVNFFRIVTIFSLVMLFHTATAEPIIRLNATGQPPLNTKSQDGFMDEVATEAFRRIGFELKTVFLPAERGLKNSNRGLIDGEMSRVKGLEKIYSNLVCVPEKIMDWEFVVFSSKAINLKNGWSDLSAQAVAHINGWKILEKNIPASAEVTKTRNADELFSLLTKKRIDLIIYERWAGHLRLHKLSLDSIKERRPALAVKGMFIYLHKKHKALVPKLSAALEGMKKDGSYQEFVKKHLKPLAH